MARLRALMRIARYAWAGPYTAVGLLLGAVAVLCGARAQLRRGALEIGGGRLGALAARLPPRFAFTALTLGHVIFGIDRQTLESVRAHEQVHVRQYERWGPFFVPAYFLASLLELVRGGRPYLDNYFEREACRGTDGPGADTGSRRTARRRS